MIILTLNLRHGGGSRITEITEYLAGATADVLVLSEYRAGKPGEKLEARLHRLGYTWRWRSVTEPKANGVMIASRLNAEPITLDAGPNEAKRIVGCSVDRMDVFGVYFALSSGKQGLYRFTEENSSEWTSRSSILIGDFNTGRHWMDENAATFKLSERFVGLEETYGWVDMWRHFHGAEARQFTWYSPKGNGFRLDHAFASEKAKRVVKNAEYDHRTRPDIADHSAMIVEVA